MYRTLNSHAYAAYIVGHETRTQIMDGALEHQKLYDVKRAGAYHIVPTI